MRIGIAYGDERIAQVLNRLILNHSDHEVVWIACSSTQVFEKAIDEKPDLILLDLNIPSTGGVEATRRMMKQAPCALLLLVQSVNWRSAEIFEAMGYGALDVLAMQTSIGEIEKEALLKKIETIGLLIGHHCNQKKSGINIHGKKASKLPHLVLIGASTGGPLALAKLLADFPQHSSLAIVAIQHVDEKFAAGFANWLNRQISLEVKIADQGTQPEEGFVLIAGTNHHLIMNQKLELVYAPNPLDSPYRPSVDVLFNSVAEHWPNRGVAVLLTGMGSDGAKGLKRLHDLGWHTIAQREESCVVYGMPKAAVDLAAVRETLQLEKIADSIKSYFNLNPVTRTKRGLYE
ncbi:MULTISPECIES: chemotaxis-specific protein-glutamate methyltransferase CheB [Parachlamydia]|uniref:chemotaxis-specific protein-glutamate methyltransferase CheB n=1 Tax=Parachlamydia TaxID=83551 RepID=UPI0024E22BC3|nr:chemotaxis-specific protein-glutamate methyltransferase CheB [Parachlamydia acanthamoebae]